MNSFIKTFIIGFVSLLTSYCTFCQGISKPELYKVTQAPPDATALGKYGEYPVSLYQGAPNIQVPLYEINCGRIKVPIGLSYHTGELK
jgi:hypothetical protein